MTAQSDTLVRFLLPDAGVRGVHVHLDATWAEILSHAVYPPAAAELLAPDGRQAAAIVWRRDAMVVGTDKPSLSRIGDAHQLAEPLGDMVGDALAPSDRALRPRPDLDPCRRFGPRVRVEGILTGIATGLYEPALSGGPRAAPNSAELAMCQTEL